MGPKTDRRTHIQVKLRSGAHDHVPVNLSMVGAESDCASMSMAGRNPYVQQSWRGYEGQHVGIECALLARSATSPGPAGL